VVKKIINHEGHRGKHKGTQWEKSWELIPFLLP